MAWIFERSANYKYKGKQKHTRPHFYIGCRVKHKTYFTKVIRCDVAGAQKLAEKRRAEIQLLVADNKFLESRKKKEAISFVDICNEYLENHAQHKRSYEAYQDNVNVLQRFFADKALDEITKDDIAEFKNKRLKEVSGSTINRNLAILSGIFTYAKKHNKIKENPVEGVEKFEENEREIYLERDEINALLTAAEKAPKYLKLILVIALNTGLRKSPILNLKWQDVDVNRNQIKIIKENSKNKKPIYIPLNEEVRSALIKYKRKNPNSDFIFCNENGECIKDIKKTFLTTVKRSGILNSLRKRTNEKFNLHFHDLRHTFASWWVMLGGDLYTLQQILAHSSSTMTQRYAHLSPDYMQNAMNSFSRRFNKESAIQNAIQTHSAEDFESKEQFAELVATH